MSKIVDVKGEVDFKQWEQLKEKFANLEDSELLEKIINEYYKLISDESKEGNLITELANQQKLAESLRKKCKNFALRVKQLEDIQVDQEGEIQKHKKQIKKLSKDFPDIGEEKVREKIVYREDTKTIKELKEKRDSLQKSLWEKNADLEKTDKIITDLKRNLDNFEVEKGKVYAILVKLALNKETSIYEFSFENISRGEFNKLMRSKVEFCKYKKIFTPASVIRLWEIEEDDTGIIDLNEAVLELRNKNGNKLNEISLPYSQYESLKSFEGKYTALKKEADDLRVNFKDFEEQNKKLLSIQENLQNELTHLKENPVIKEKIVYKENTKELSEIKSECERLRLKLFNFETGRMSIPTHGINVGNIYKVKILGVGKDGDGFTKVNNFIIFIPATTTDQEVNIKITRVLKKYAFGKVLEGEPAEDERVHDATTGSVSNPASTNQSQPATEIPNDAVVNPGEEVKAEEEEE